MVKSKWIGDFLSVAVTYSSMDLVSSQNGAAL